nr:hypothetical protein [uncultured Flavobacterium sp.]
MKAYQDKSTGKWKWGTRGAAIYDTKEIAERAGLDILTRKLREIKDRLNSTLINHGRI